MKARAKTNIILADGTFVKRNTVIDDSVVPEKMRPKFNYEDLSEREGQVMLINGLGCCDKNGYWMSLTAGELIRLDQIPERVRENLKEGVHYIKDWTKKDHLRVREEETQRQLKMLQSEPLETYETTVTGWKIK